MGKGISALFGKRLWWTVATVVALALVITVVAAVSSPKREKTSAAPDPVVSAEALALKAETALSDGETSTAVTLAEQALDADPTNKKATTVIERATTEPEREPSSGDQPADPDEPAPQNDDAYSKAVADMSSLLPASISGWSAATVVVQKTEALVTFEPKLGAPHEATTMKALVIAHDRGSKSKAAEFVEKVDKRVYANSSGAADVGAVSAYFGTDGKRLAVVAFARGRFAFEVILTAQQGVKPTKLKQAGIDVASKLPAAK